MPTSGLCFTREVAGAGVISTVRPGRRLGLGPPTTGLRPTPTCTKAVSSFLQSRFPSLRLFTLCTAMAPLGQATSPLPSTPTTPSSLSFITAAAFSSMPCSTTFVKPALAKRRSSFTLAAVQVASRPICILTMFVSSFLRFLTWLALPMPCSALNTAALLACHSFPESWHGDFRLGTRRAASARPAKRHLVVVSTVCLVAPLHSLFKRHCLSSTQNMIAGSKRPSLGWTAASRPATRPFRRTGQSSLKRWSLRFRPCLRAMAASCPTAKRTAKQAFPTGPRSPSTDTTWGRVLPSGTLLRWQVVPRHPCATPKPVTSSRVVTTRAE
eukprot:m.488858 g.488858  ORF g.488858 m.488858 type:complete len:326 (+) comp26156_c0_seq1:244-1221(+)